MPPTASSCFTCPLPVFSPSVVTSPTPICFLAKLTTNYYPKQLVLPFSSRFKFHTSSNQQTFMVKNSKLQFTFFFMQIYKLSFPLMYGQPASHASAVYSKKSTEKISQNTVLDRLAPLSKSINVSSQEILIHKPFVVS